MIHLPIQLFFKKVAYVVLCVGLASCTILAASTEKYQKIYKLVAVTSFTCDLPCNLTIQPTAPGEEPSLMLEGALEDSTALAKLKVEEKDGNLSISFIEKGRSFSCTSNSNTESNSLHIPFFSSKKKSFCFQVTFEDGEEIILNQKPTLILKISAPLQDIVLSRPMDARVKQGIFDLSQATPQVNIDLCRGSTLKIAGGFCTKDSQIKLRHGSSFTREKLIAEHLTLLARHHSKIDISNLEASKMDINMLHSSKLTVKTFHGDHLRGHLLHHAKLSIQGGKVKIKDISARQQAQLDTNGLEVEEIT